LEPGRGLMTLSNKKTGSGFEKEFAKLLFDKGYWVMEIADDKEGQPFDVIAAKYNRVYAFECKTCSTKMFDISRIEVNQRYAMKFFTDRGNDNCFFAFKYNGNIYYEKAVAILKAESNIDVSQLSVLREWIL
jgi:Holliday junction resolvase